MMFDFECFNQVAMGANCRAARYCINPHPEYAEAQLLQIGFPPAQPATNQGTSECRSPYPRVVEEQFLLGIK